MPNRMRTVCGQAEGGEWTPGVGVSGRRAACWVLAVLLVMFGPGWLVGLTPAQVTEQAATPTSGFQVSVDQFGLGNVTRAGGWIGLRVRFRDDVATPRDVILEAEVRDPDGDQARYRRVVTANPGRWQQAWVYVYLPYDFDPSRGLRVRAREVVSESGEQAVREGQDAEAARRGRLLGETLARPTQMLQDDEGVLGIVGNQVHGLSAYSSSLSGANFSPLAHERTALVSQLAPLDLPDRWMGLAGLEVLVWSGGDPADLGAERARALREWIERGGHLVVMMSITTQGAWTTSTNNLLRDLFPAAEVRVREGVNLNEYRNLITREPSMGLPGRAVVHTFEPMASAGDQEAIRVLDGPGGECVVVRRIVGHGMVTAVGMGVGSAELSAAGLPAADVFWNRVLGRRGQFETLTRLNQIATGNVPLGRRDDPVVLERGIDARVNLTGQSLAGVVLAFAVFGLYWLVAGPGGFAVLKRSGRQQHAWVAFVGAAALFTAIAWGGATIIKPKRVEVRHVTVLDHVYGQDVDRARTWMSVLVPSYLGAEVGLASSASGGMPRFHQLVSPWEARADVDLGRGVGGSFPDARGYDIDSRQPDGVSFPTRATVKQLQLEWAGPARLAWPMPVGGDAGAIRLDPASDMPVGVLTHNLPGALRDVQVIVVRRQSLIRNWTPGSWAGRDGLAQVLQPLWLNYADAISVSPGGDWAPGQPLDLGAQFAQQRGASLSVNNWLDRAAAGVSLDGGLRYASLFHQLSPPEFSQAAAARRFQRVAMHGLDLSKWFSQPCVIVLATLDLEGEGAMPMPVEVRVGGEVRTPTVRGTTLVRWVYPLGSSPPAWSTGQVGGEGDSGEGPGLTEPGVVDPGVRPPRGGGRPPG